jgi:hypothetical protein
MGLIVLPVTPPALARVRDQTVPTSASAEICGRNPESACGTFSSTTRVAARCAFRVGLL